MEFLRRRREFITLLGGAAAWPLAARAQEARRIYRLGVLHQLPRTAPQFAHLLDGLRREGFIEGRNLAIDPRGFDSRSEQYQERATQIVNSGIDVLVCGGDLTIRVGVVGLVLTHLYETSNRPGAGPGRRAGPLSGGGDGHQRRG